MRSNQAFFLVLMFITRIKLKAQSKKEEPQHTNYVLKLSFVLGADVYNQPQTRGLKLKKEEPQHADCVPRLSTGLGDRS